MTTRPSAASKFFYRIPVIGWIARDISRDINNIWYALVIVVTAVFLAVWAWGIVALAMVALATVPVIFALLLAITFG
ncbi:MAG: hypothetical protein DI533_15220 [Cereibacter sphaeroides]|uniref:Uncharacterized protein n=1 Tax=Cereibacter sphaeroides TaxID=1063 RepID=A0A2W5S577_CERSP|nr:MAG: hypothetical protein DI533_15220 [Cereibacter sphaeroides]